MTPQESLDFQVAALESTRSVYAEVGNYAYAPTGDAYVTFSCSGVIKEGEMPAIICTTSDAAIRYWMQEFRHYAKSHEGVLYWRVRPLIEIVEFQLKEPYAYIEKLQYWQVYARLVISNKPIIQPAHRAA